MSMWVDDLKSLRREKLIGRDILFFPEIDSTNREARDRAREGAREGTVVLADFQSGEGTPGRAWESPSGANVCLSVILRPPIPPPAAPQITLLAGVSAARALSHVSGLECRVKWPMTSSSGEKNGRDPLGDGGGRRRDPVHHPGIGVNVNWEKGDFPPELRGQPLLCRQRRGKRFPGPRRRPASSGSWKRNISPSSGRGSPPA